MRRTLTTVLAAGALIAGATLPAVAGPPERTTIVDKAIELNSSGPFAGEFDILIEAVVGLDLVDTLSGNRQFTVFAPTDGAFEAFFADNGVADLAELVAAVGVETATNVVLYHVAPGERFAADVIDSDQIRTMYRVDGKTPAFAPVTFDGTDVMVDEGTVIVPNVDVDNGVIHAVNAVLNPLK